MLSDTKFALFIPIPKLKSYIALYRQRKQDLYPTHSSMYNWKYIAVYKKKKKRKETNNSGCLCHRPIHVLMILILFGIVIVVAVV